MSHAEDRDHEHGHDHDHGQGHDHGHGSDRGRGHRHETAETSERDLASTGPIAILSCIHANLPALEAVWADLKSRGIDHVLCLGDLVGYGPHPAEVVEFVRRERIPTLQGCWDRNVGAAKDPCICHVSAAAEKAADEWSYRWTQERLDDEQRSFLGALPPRLAATAAGSRLVAVHGSPRSPHEHLTATAHELVLYERAGAAGADILVFGHTHSPYVKRIEGEMRVTIDTTLAEGRSMPSEAAPLAKPVRPKLFVNAGSVGAPAHGSPEACYAVFSPAEQEVEIVFVDYDVERTAAAMRQAGMPAIFAERLARGVDLTVKDLSLACDC